MKTKFKILLIIAMFCSSLPLMAMATIGDSLFQPREVRIEEYRSIGTHSNDWDDGDSGGSISRDGSIGEGYFVLGATSVLYVFYLLYRKKRLLAKNIIKVEN